MAETLRIANWVLLRLEEGLRQLDAVREDKDKLVGFEFETKPSYRLMRGSVAALRAKAAFDMADQRLRATHEVYEGMLISYPPDTKPTADQLDAAAANAKKVDAYQRARAVLLNQEADVDGALMMTLDQLFNRPESDPKKTARRNPIPQSVIAKLAPIIEEEAE